MVPLSGGMATTRRDRLRRWALVAGAVAAVLLVIVLAILVFKLVSGTPSKTTEQRLSVAATVAAIVGGLSGFASLILNALRSRAPRPDRSTLVLPQLMDDALLFDRAKEMDDLITGIDHSKVVNCWGDQGAGKSFLLAHLTDVVNGFRSRNDDHPKLKGVSAALYYDLADAVGFEAIQAHVCRQVLGKENGTWNEFIAYVNKVFAGRRLLLVLDNVNTPGLWPAAGSAAFQYLASRPGDRLILGSISRVQVNNLTIRRVSVGGLDFAATEQLVASNGIVIDRVELAELHDHCGGLPFFVEMLAPFGGATADAEIEGMEAAIEAQLIPRLDPTTRDLLAHASLLAVVSRPISIADLEKCPLPNLQTRLKAAKGMLTPIPGDRRLLRIHDVLRNIALRALVPEVPDAAGLHFRQAREAGRTTDAALFAMFADPGAIGATAFDEVLEPVVKAAVKSRNYAVLDNLYLWADRSLPVMQLLSADQSRQDLFCYGRSSQLAGMGDYVEAEDKLLQGRIGRVPDLRQAPRSPLEPEMHFLLADIAHLQNRYDDAAAMFEELGEWATSTGEDDLLTRCVWGRGHVLRHQGRDLEQALALFESAVELATPAGGLFAKAYSVTGATGIKVFMGTVPADEEQRLAKIEDEIAVTHTHHNYMLEVWKSRAQVAWFRSEVDSALSIVEDAVKKALDLNDRLLYNLYFERAEFGRLTGEHESALVDYRRVLEFGEGNGDRNLTSNTRLGLVLTDLSAGNWVHHGSSDHARASALEARRIALNADIQATAGIAGRVATMTDGDLAGEAELLRLILF